MSSSITDDFLIYTAFSGIASRILNNFEKKFVLPANIEIGYRSYRAYRSYFLEAYREGVLGFYGGCGAGEDNRKRFSSPNPNFYGR